MSWLDELKVRWMSWTNTPEGESQLPPESPKGQARVSALLDMPRNQGWWDSRTRRLQKVQRLQQAGVQLTPDQMGRLQRWLYMTKDPRADLYADLQDRWQRLQARFSGGFIDDSGWTPGLHEARQATQTKIIQILAREARRRENTEEQEKITEDLYETICHFAKSWDDPRGPAKSRPQTPLMQLFLEETSLNTHLVARIVRDHMKNEASVDKQSALDMGWRYLKNHHKEWLAVPKVRETALQHARADTSRHLQTWLTIGAPEERREVFARMIELSAPQAAEWLKATVQKTEQFPGWMTSELLAQTMNLSNNRLRREMTLIARQYRTNDRLSPSEQLEKKAMPAREPQSPSDPEAQSQQAPRQR